MQRALTSLLYSTLPLTILSCLTPITAEAQVIPDGTTNTTVNIDGNDVTIEQGDRIGDNLFHSFSEFSILTDGSAFFNNAADIANIFSRVTGSNISNINGLLGANGAANLFLINPNGIIFGPNARLNLGGSFFASSTDSLLFEGNAEFSASNPTAPPLLKISIPIGINFRDNPGKIVNRSTVENSAGDVVGLEVLPGKNITLVGGNINFEAGNATARGGNIELSGLSGSGTVVITDDGSLNFPEGVAQADINLSNEADIDVRGTSGGSITMNARNLNLEAEDFGNSLIRAGIATGSTSSEAQAGDITIKATDNITVENSSIENQVDSEAVGDAGTINIKARSISLSNSLVSSSVLTNARGNGGQVTITTDSLTLLKGSLISTGTTSTERENGQSNAGSIEINISNSFEATDGSILFSSSFGGGDAGNININGEGATISLDGIDNDGTPSTIFTSVAQGAVGRGGDIFITAKSLDITNEAAISSSSVTTAQGNGGSVNITATDSVNLTNGAAIISGTSTTAQGNGGDINITTKSLSLTNGGLVSSRTSGQGNAGDVTVNARESIEISGAIERFRSGISANASISNGNGGNINVFTNRLTIDDGGTIEAGNFDSLGIFTPGTGQPGNIHIQTNSLSLNNQASIEATTQSETDNSANITLQLDGDLILSNNSLISGEAFKKANGGNIDIDAQFIIAYPSQPPEDGNDIIARAEKGKGGNINIDAKSLINIEERRAEPRNGTNDIDASSDIINLEGDVSVNTPEVDPTSGLIKLPKAVIDAADQISQNICEQGVGSEFIITGKGGLPPNPGEPLNNDEEQISLVEPVPSRQEEKKKRQEEEIKPEENSISSEKPTTEAVPAQGWIFTDTGEVMLTSYDPTNSGIQRSQQKPIGCPTP